MDGLKNSETNKQKKKHPYEKSNACTNIFFCWMLPLFVKGFKKELNEDDMYGAMEAHESNKLGSKLEASWSYEIAHKKNPSLWRALLRVFKFDYAVVVFTLLLLEFVLKANLNNSKGMKMKPGRAIGAFFVSHNRPNSLNSHVLDVFKRRLIMMKTLLLVKDNDFKVAFAHQYFNLQLNEISMVFQLSSYPLLLSQFLKLYEPNQTSMDKSEACVYAGLLVLSTFLQVIVGHRYMVYVLHLGMKIRVAMCSLIYRKALRLSKTALVETTVGQMVNLISNDVARFENIIIHVNYLWLAPIETIIYMVVLYKYVGYSGLIGTIFLLLFAPFQLYMGKKTSSYRLSTALRTDERVRLMSEILTGIQVIKMYTWEKPFAKLVEISRRKEMQQIKATSVIRAIMNSLILVMNPAAIYFCNLTYVLTGNAMNASYAYTISSFYGILRDVVTKNFPKGLTDFAETSVSIKRIKKFLLCDEIKDDKETVCNYINSIQTKHQSGLDIFMSRNKNTENKPVGIDLKDVSVKWADSSPENTMSNISFKVNSKQLVAVVGQVGSGKTTLLHIILKELYPLEGSVDIAGTLSYASQEPWLFGGSVRQNIIFGQEFEPKKYAEVVRVCALERDLKLFPYGDKTIVGDRGVTLSGGQRARINLARAIYKEADIYLLDDPLSAVDAHVGKQLFDDCICSYLKDKCVVLVTHQLQYLKNVQLLYLLNDGKVEASGSYTELQTSGCKFTQILNNQEKEDEKSDRKSRRLSEKQDSEEIDPQSTPLEEREQRGSGMIPFKVYRSYFRAGGNSFKTIFVLLSFIVSQLLSSSTDYFVNIWVNIEQWKTENNNRTLNNTSPELSKQPFLSSILTEQNTIIIYSVIILTTIVITFSRSIYFFKYCMIASTRLHNFMFNKIVYATMRFFNTNPPGRILNRFSKDIGNIDELLPLNILDTVQVGLNVLFVSLVIGSLNPWTLLPTLVILVIFYFLRLVYLATSRDIKRVESVSRSPMYTHLSASLQGLTTIRAFGAQEVLKKEFDNYQNKYSGPFFLYIAANRTFGFWLDIHCVVYLAFVIINILFIENEMFGGNVGLALTQSITLTGMFQWGMRQWSELETNMTSVERVQEYIDISPEKEENVKEPPKFWPENGNIKFDNMSLRYSPDDPYTLKKLSFEIKGQEKVGIVGRTGAGKSSLISALFRLTYIDGRILIDDVDTKEIPLTVLRSKISIIPQEPVLFSGPLRKNLDPFEEYNDEVLWDALSEVELKHAVSDLPAGLDSRISEGGSNFSVGQRQLLCLARAIIRNNKILVLDEATANVDPHTDGLIQNTIRRKFATCTVLTIAHRLHTIMDSDKVLVMDAGRAVEFDHPYKLLQNPNGVFCKLVAQTGKSTTKSLSAVAEENYKNSAS
ncbi:hypothetical protein NQ317_003466 [Molorchus minor]|uniref:Multidrug resistance-associated protein lethal(2)03659 n=1 Tax=Molorchus minor TaxID=1323400 RepID=A0ABQ9K262_9CUCU|nr:hypothetical protein NQ317_003466 [Molorchus minor]